MMVSLITYVWITHNLFKVLKGRTREIPEKASVVVLIGAEDSHCEKGTEL